MARNRTRLLATLAVVALALTGVLFAGIRASAQIEDRPITLDLRDADLEDALRLIFKDTPYSFTLEPGIGGTVTLTLNNVTFSQALRAILEMHGLTYRKEDRIYHITSEPIEPPGFGTEPPVQPTPRVDIYWFGPGGRYELQYLDCRLVIAWFGGSQIPSSLIPFPAEGGTGGGTGGRTGGTGGIGGGTSGGIGGSSMGGGIGGSTGGIGGGSGGIGGGGGGRGGGGGGTGGGGGGGFGGGGGGRR